MTIILALVVQRPTVLKYDLLKTLNLAHNNIILVMMVQRALLLTSIACKYWILPTMTSIGADGAKAIAAHFNCLQVLDLDNNNICANGAKAIADVLQYCCHLETLILTHNAIGDNGIMAWPWLLVPCCTAITLRHWTLLIMALALLV